MSMSFKNTQPQLVSNLRRSLDAKQDWAAGQERSSYRDLNWIDQPREGGFKSREDLNRLFDITVGDLFIVQHDAEVTAFGRSSEAGERERQAQAQHSRGFYADPVVVSPDAILFDRDEEAAQQNAREEADLAWEVALQEQDFGPDDDEDAALDAKRKALGFCRDCGEPGETRGHQECQYPSNDAQD